MFGTPVAVAQCETASQVFDLARRVRENRRRSLAPVELKPKRPALFVQSEPIAPSITISWWKTHPEDHPAFNDLVLMTGGDKPSTPFPKFITVREIQKAVCKAFHVNIMDVLSERRTSQATVPRHVAMVLSKGLTTRSYPDIGRKFGGRDHTTIIHACQKYQWLLDKLRSEFDLSTPLSTWSERAAQLVFEDQKLREHLKVASRFGARNGKS